MSAFHVRSQVILLLLVQGPPFVSRALYPHYSQIAPQRVLYLVLNVFTFVVPGGDNHLQREETDYPKLTLGRQFSKSSGWSQAWSHSEIFAPGVVLLNSVNCLVNIA